MNLKNCFLFKFGLQFKCEQQHMVSYLDILDDHIKTHDEIKIDSRYLLDEHKL